jgi:hypothetical protein
LTYITTHLRQVTCFGGSLHHQSLFQPSLALFPIARSTMEASQCSSHVRLPDPRQTHVLDSGIPGPACFEGGLRGTRARLPVRMILALAFFALFSPATAFDNESHSLSYASRIHHHGDWTPITYCLAILLLIGHQSVNWSKPLLATLMGITSVLWLMMRNDAAISPKASWM